MKSLKVDRAHCEAASWQCACAFRGRHHAAVILPEKMDAASLLQRHFHIRRGTFVYLFHERPR
jgi:hypothetical protein